MDAIIGKPHMLKQVNLALLRKIFQAEGAVTRGELSEATGLSATTVRALLSHLLEQGEIESVGQDESSGGRKAERYRYCPERYHAVAFCVSGCQLHGVVSNLWGQVVESVPLEVEGEDVFTPMFAFLDGQLARREIRAIGLGVPGVVSGTTYWKKRLEGEEMFQVDVGELFAGYRLPLVLENDVNATAIGLGRCYSSSFPGEGLEAVNMAYLHFEKGCISGGFLAEGRILRGWGNFAGELGLVPMGEGLLDERLNQPMGEQDYVALVAQTLTWICAILNPQYIALGGPEVRAESVGAIGDLLYALLPRQMAAELLYIADPWQDYHRGMAYLVSEKMFEEPMGGVGAC